MNHRRCWIPECFGAGWCWVILVNLALLAPDITWAICLTPPGDITGDGVSNVQDVQCNVVANLWSLAGQGGDVPLCITSLGSPSIVPDHNCDGVINVSDTQLAVTFAFKSPLAVQLDANANQCVDACEIDTDGDGDFDLADCAPLDGAIHHGAAELCNGYDDDCDGGIDEPAEPTVAASCAASTACVLDGTCPTAPSVAGVVITEVQHSPDAVPDSVGEWFELYNGLETPVNIQGWTFGDLEGEVHTIDAGGAIFVPAKGFLVLGRSKNLAQNGGVRVAYAYQGVNFDGAQDALVLYTAGGVEVDRVAYASTAGFPLVSGRSLALKSPALDNLAASAWAASSRLLPGGDRGTPVGPNADVAPAACESGAPVSCTDGNPCTDDACDGDVGCVYTYNAAPCAGSNPCTTQAMCVAGACTGGTPVSCDDGNACTADTCHPALGCLHQAILGDCEDGNACTALDVCLSGACVPGIPAFCDDFEPCTTDSCAPATGCTHAPLNGPCEDGNACTVLDVCVAGDCISGVSKVCSDGSACTVDACHVVLGCIFTPVLAPCSDGNACTAGDVCINGTCVGGPAPVCDDLNPCTSDSCVAPGGCAFIPSAGTCSDGNACTVNDVCSGGICTGGTTALCNDGNPCTQDGCHPLTGCTTAPVSSSCNDGNACTTTDTCQSGTCVGASPLVCNDGDPCTTDSCQSQSGCAFAANSVACSDGDPCTTGDACQGGACIPGAGTLSCNDGNSCTADECVPGIGCTNAALPDGEPCLGSDGFACSVDGCMSGQCQSVWLTPRIFTDIGGLFYDVLRVADGFILTGYRSVGPGVKDVLVMKADPTGEVVWENDVDGYATGSEEGYKIKPMPDGGFIIAASPNDRLLRFDADGELLSDTSSGTGNAFWGVDVYADGSVIGAGWTSNTFGTGDDMWLVKKSPAGSVMWSKKLNKGISDRAFDVVALPDGGALAVGYAIPAVNDVHGWAVRVDASGIMTWDRYYTTGTYSAFSSVEPTADGGFILAGRRQTSTSKLMEMWVVKYDASYNETFNTSLGGTKSDDAQNIMVAKDGGYVAVGQYQTVSPTNVIQQRIWVVKLAASGSKQWEYLHNQVGGWANGAAAISDEGGVAVAAWQFTPNPILFFLENNGAVCQ